MEQNVTLIQAFLKILKSIYCLFTKMTDNVTYQTQHISIMCAAFPISLHDFKKIKKENSNSSHFLQNSEALCLTQCWAWIHSLNKDERESLVKVKQEAGGKIPQDTFSHDFISFYLVTRNNSIFYFPSSCASMIIIFYCSFLYCLHSWILDYIIIIRFFCFISLWLYF